ncbi:MAG: nucleotidyltransferase family protein [Enhygromyxa sp.]
MPEPRWQPGSAEAALIHAARIFDPDPRPLSGPTSSAAQWRRFIELGELHRVLPAAWLGARVQGRAIGEPPADVESRWSDAWARARSRAEVQGAALRSLLRALHDAELRCPLISGELMAYARYPDPAARPFGDFDLLVGDSDMRRVAAVLEQLGYVQGFAAGGAIRRPSRRERMFARMFMKHPVAWVRYVDDELFVVEPHSTIFWRRRDGTPAFAMPMAELLERAEPLTIGDAPAWRLSNEDQLLYQCIDVYEDARRIWKIRSGEDLQLIRLLDCVASLRAGVDWSVFVERVRRWGLQLPIYATLSWLLDAGLVELGAALPAEVLEATTPDSPEEVDAIGFPEELREGATLGHVRRFAERLFALDHRRALLDSDPAITQTVTLDRLEALAKSELGEPIDEGETECRS